VEIRPYTEHQFDECVAVFMSNRDKYFADHELEEFKLYLRKETLKDSYFCVYKGNQVIGCGGFSKEDNEVFLTWGMIRRDLHKQGYGKTLTKFRMKAIREKYPNTPIIINTAQFTKGFYEKQGFKTKAFKKNGFGSGLDKYTMTD
jgi:ribosomal protein S18 acetylase RimI-like enzyme